MRILLFLGLKLAEISTIVFIPYWLGKLLFKIPFVKGTFNGVPLWFLGNFGIVVLFAILGITYMILKEILPFICRVNWNWAGEILKKEEK